MSIAENYVGILGSILLLSCNEFILKLHPILKNRLSEWLYNLSIYSVYNQVSVMIIADHYVGIFL